MTQNTEQEQMQDEGNLTSEEIEALISGEPEEGKQQEEAPKGDTEQSESGKPDADNSEGGEVGDEDEDKYNADNAVILAKDNKHTISYDKLVEARQQAQAAKQQAEEARQELERLKAEAQERADAGEDATKQDNQLAMAEAAMDAGVDPDLFGDFSEEALAAGINKLVAMQLEQKLGEALAPLNAQKAQTEAEAHMAAIIEAHPDAHSIAESQEFEKWMQEQPSFVRQAYEQVFNDGSTEEVIELFSLFKNATGQTQSADSLREQARRNMAASLDKAPVSLSELSGGRVGATSKLEAMQEKSGIELVEDMGDMSPEQLEQFLNSL